MILIADSGSTKTDWALTANGGDVELFRTKGINPFHQDEATIEAIICDELLSQFPVNKVSEVFFYGSGLRPELQPMMQELLLRCFPQAYEIETHGDLLGAARALCGQREGIACILGTGANSCLFDGKDICENTPPLGYVLGDEGSGAVLGIRFLNALYKGLLPKNIQEAFLVEYQMTMADVIARVYRQSMPNRFLASLSPFISHYLGIPIVRQMVVENFQQFLRRNIKQYRRPDLPVSAVGSIAYYYADLLREAIESEGFQMGVIRKSPIEGLLRYHLEQTAPTER